MTEKLLQFIWKHRYFNQQSLVLENGDTLIIDFPGEENTGQGPDFIGARIKINNRSWVGSIELHLFSSGWNKHNHESDGNYTNVILHVVWKRDPVNMERNIPELELCHRISTLMLETYQTWMKKPQFIPCEKHLVGMDEESWKSWSKSLIELRFERKKNRILESLRQNQFHWEEQLWWMVAAGYGYPVNQGSFETIARSIPYSVIVKHRFNQLQLEALFAGQAKLLDAQFRDPYPKILKKEYQFLKKKYSLKEVYEPVHFLRMRPESFPGIRLSQLAMFASEATSFFTCILQCETPIALRKKLMTTANDYWDNHFVFEKAAPHRKKQLGTAMANTIIINSVIPILYAYGKINPDLKIIQKSLEWLDKIPSEQNRVVQGWRRAGLSIKKSKDSQAVIELKKVFCDHRKCLQCDIGKNILAIKENEKSEKIDN